jgi:hypothetical protein
VPIDFFSLQLTIEGQAGFIAFEPAYPRRGEDRTSLKDEIESLLKAANADEMGAGT